MATSHLEFHSMKVVDYYNNYNGEQEITNNTGKNISKKNNFRNIKSVQTDKGSLQTQEWLREDNPSSSSSYVHSKHNNYTTNLQRLKYNRKRSYTKNNHFIPKPNFQECTTTKSDTNNQGVQYSSENININNKRQKMMTVETQSKKTPITLLNDWAMRGDGSNNHIDVSYTLASVGGSTHKPTFKYVCRVLKNTTVGEGGSKKEAKQNSAAEMWKTHISYIANNDKVITSTTTTNNLKVNTNEIDKLTKNLEKINENEKEQISSFNKSQTENCIMNPIGALQEMCTAYKWIPPTYYTQKVPPCNADHKLSYKVICCVFFLQTEGHGSTKQEAKRNSARLMNKLIYNIGTDKLNEIKRSDNKFILPIEIYENSTSKNKESKKPIWNTAKMFRTYFRIAANITRDVHDEMASLYSYSNNIDCMTLREHEMELENLIIEFNSDSNTAVKQLEFLGEQLGFIISFVTVDQLKMGIHQDKQFTILLQVTTKPVIVTTATGSSTNEALEEAAKNILIMMRSMMLFTTST